MWKKFVWVRAHVEHGGLSGGFFYQFWRSAMDTRLMLVNTFVSKNHLMAPSRRFSGLGVEIP